MYVSLYENRNRDREKDIIASPRICQLIWDKTKNHRIKGEDLTCPSTHSTYHEHVMSVAYRDYPKT